MSKKVYQEGIRFECQGTGKCCLSRGTHGYVYMTLQDRKRMAKHFELTTHEFTKLHCDKTEGWYHLKVPQGDCKFLQDKKCLVYDARPTQCRTWPFWPENMTAKAWNKEVIQFCAGIGKGRLYSPQEIEKILKEDPLNT